MRENSLVGSDEDHNSIGQDETNKMELFNKNNYACLSLTRIISSNGEKIMNRKKIYIAGTVVLIALLMSSFFLIVIKPSSIKDWLLTGIPIFVGVISSIYYLVKTSVELDPGLKTKSEPEIIQKVTAERTEIIHFNQNADTPGTTQEVEAIDSTLEVISQNAQKNKNQ